LVVQGKVILVLSPQSWGPMHISKHHYAMALARKGNRVYYLNPPAKKWRGRFDVTVSPIKEQQNLWLVDHTLAFPYNLKFHAPRLFNVAMGLHLRALCTKLPPIDLVWSFDLGGMYPLTIFARAQRVFHPVDEPLGYPNALRAANGAQAIFSVTREILESYRSTGVPRHFINHGISDDFVGLAKGEGMLGSGAPSPLVRVGISGNLTRPDLDHDVLRQIIEQNPEVIFELWGAYDVRSSNLAGSDGEDVRNLVAWLKQAPNVILHGAVPSHALPAGYQRMDAFLITYDVQRDQSRGTYYH
jgi:hypothetical protein